MIHILYGYGKGKTTSSIGAGIRAYGAGKSVLFVQFFKDNKSSELASIPFEVYPAPEHLPFNPGSDYKAWVNSAIDYVKSGSADVVILDEFVDLIPQFLSVNDALGVLSRDREYILTGHNRVDKLFDVADYITNLQKEKHPYDKGITARKGIEY